MKTPKEFVQDLKNLFADKKPFLLCSKQRDSVFDTIQAHLQKKNLIVISRAEYDALLKECQDAMASKIIDEILAERG